MTDRVLVFYYADSCETCHFSRKEPHDMYRCSEDTNVEFKQNRDMGVPAGCPFRKMKPPG